MQTIREHVISYDHNSADSKEIGCRLLVTGLYSKCSGCKKVPARFICKFNMLTTLHETIRHHQLFGMLCMLMETRYVNV